VLGDKIGEMTGRVISTRVLPGDDYRFIKMEITVQENGKILGVDGMNIGTYVVYERVPGQIYGSGQGLVEAGGGEGAIWNGHGVSKMAAGMQAAFRFSLAFQAGQGGTLSRLNEVLVIGEHDVDTDGNTKTTLWEWK